MVLAVGLDPCLLRHSGAYYAGALVNDDYWMLADSYGTCEQESAVQETVLKWKLNHPRHHLPEAPVAH
jgi:hypothetical protein